MKAKLSGTGRLYIILASFVSILLFSSRHYTYEVRLVPFLIGIPTLFFLAILLIDEIYPQLLHKKKISSDEQLSEVAMECKENNVEDSEITPWLPILRVIGWIVFLFIFIFWIGFYLAAPLFIIMFFIIEAKIDWRWSIIISVIGTGLIYSFITILLKIKLWEGAIPEFISDIIGGAIIPPI